nr:leu/Ile/Val-binding protein homolog 3-like [Nerophis lumbriciformis]
MGVFSRTSETEVAPMKRLTAGTLFLLILGALALLATGCGQKTAKIGAVLPLTGVARTYGTPIQNGLEIALEQLRADATFEHELEWVIVDSESDPQKAKEQIEELYDGGAIAVIGGCTSAEAKEMVPVAEGYDRVLLSPSASSPDLTGVSENFYRVSPSDYLEANKMADFAARQLQIKSVVLLAEQNLEYAKGIQVLLKEQFELFGVEILDVIEYPERTTDFSGLVERAVTLNPDAVYLAAYAEGISSMILELHTAGFEGKILTTQAFADVKWIQKTGEAAEGVLLTKTVFEIDSEYAHIKTFVNAYREKFGEEPNIWAAYGYDSLRVLAEAMRGRSADSYELLKGIRGIKDFPGVIGSIQFDERGDVKIFPRVYIVKDDLGLYSFDEEFKRQQDELKKRREELQRRLEELQKEARQIGG